MGGQTGQQQPSFFPVVQFTTLDSSETVSPVTCHLSPVTYVFSHFTSSPLAITAPTEKKRRLAPFGKQSNPSRSSGEFEHLPTSPSQSPAPSASHYSQSLAANAHLASPSSSPAPRSHSAGPSSPSHDNYITRNTPPRFLPPHLHREVLPSREDGEGAIEGLDMTGGGERGLSVAGRAAGGTRSASPAKRAASEMEGVEQGEEGSGVAQDQQQTQKAPSGLAAEYDANAQEDSAMSGMTPVGNSAEDAQAMDISTSSADDDSATTAASSMESTAALSPEHNAEMHPAAAHKEPYTTEEIDAQVARVLRIVREKPLDEGHRGVVISKKWLERILSRSSEGKDSRQYAKSAREGPTGPLDNSDIVPQGAYHEPLRDSQGKEFIPLVPGLLLEKEIEVFPVEVYEYIIGTYGTAQTTPIYRYAHNTADPGTSQNIMYELYPPVVTIRKVPQTAEQAKEKSTKPLATLQAKKERLVKYGQHSPEDAPRVVSSKSERVQTFMTRAKEAAGVPRATKVKVFRLLNPKAGAVTSSGSQSSSVPSPPPSRPATPIEGTATSSTKLILEPKAFKTMKAGSDLEPVNIQDNTANQKYNGSMVLGPIVFEDQTLVFEEQLGGPGGGEFSSDSRPGFKLAPPKPTESTAASGRTSPSPSMIKRGRAKDNGRSRGTVGLSNLGNTCYMNSALQCIRSVEELATFFMTRKYKKEINGDNPLGHNGKMAHAYYSVIDGIYGNSAGGSFSPNAFKKALGNAQPMFSGWAQQDSQEFLSFLVDALHEDLNRIKKKPYIENPDSDDATVHDPQAIIDLGETYRNNHKLRNDSVAMDLFSGFFKNKMECPTCDKVSVTFDPFSLVTVQLPINTKREHIVTFIPLQGSPVRHRMELDALAPFKALKDTIASKHPGVDSDRLIMTEVFSHRVYKLFSDQATLGDDNIAKNDYIFFHEVDGVPTNPAPFENQYAEWTEKAARKKLPEDPMSSEKSDCFALPIFHQIKSGNNWQGTLHPLYITVTREEAKDYEIILKKILLVVSKLTTRPILQDFSQSQSEELADTAKEEQASSTEETASGFSDHSNPSEDGYVNVDKVRTSPEITDSQILANGTSAMQIDEPKSTIPENFMDPAYTLSPALRNHLFDVYVGGSGVLHVEEIPPIQQQQLMLPRVKLPSRRSSLTVSSSGESGSETESAVPDDGDEDMDSDRPDLVLGDEQSRPVVEDSEDELHSGNNLAPYQNGARNGREKKKEKKGKKGKRSKNPKANQKWHVRKQKKGDLPSSKKSTSNAYTPQEDSPYYVRLGECIVLHWRPEAYDALFDGDRQNQNEMRGCRTTNDDGTGCEIFPDPELDARRAKMQARQKNGVTLDECFAETGKREVLSADNAWYCNRCKEMRLAAKTLEIWTIPDILVVHLKRFGGARGSRDKIDVHVNYPITGLDMSDKVGRKEEGKEYIYDLFAVDNHYGGLGGGHYTAMAKNFTDGEWYDYNDSSCSRITNEDRVHSAAAYLLFYRRRSDKPLGPQYLQDLVTEYRAPKDSSNEDDSDSGEGRLGGPTRSQHGSSSALAEAGAAGRRKLGNNGSGGVGPGNSLTAMNENPSWSFSAIDMSDGTNEHLDSDDAASTLVQESGEEDERGSAPPSQLNQWGSDDGVWHSAEDNASGSTLHVGAVGTQHLEDANDSTDEIHLMASEHADPNALPF